MAVVKNKDDHESRKFWSHVEAVAKEVETWPQWTGNRSQQVQNDGREGETTAECSKHDTHNGGGFK